MFWVYVLQNKITGRRYIGSTENLERRLAEHNTGKTKSTMSGKSSWIVIYKEMYNSRSEASKRERKIKSYKGGEAFKKLFLRV